ncbi:MAG: thiamine diphosphokinase [Oscillospiraceae bacterium]
MNSCWIFGGAPVKGCCELPPDDAYIIAADSGYSLLKSMGIKPDLLLGDFDSLKEPKPDYCEILTVAAEKDDTDTMLAVKTALEKGYYNITITGSIGGRLDHTIANIQALSYIYDNGGKGRLIGESDIVELLGKGSYKFQRNDDMYFSIFSYSPSAIVTTTGTKYNLKEYTLTNIFPLGVSNEITSDECTLIIEKGQILVVFSKK